MRRHSTISQAAMVMNPARCRPSDQPPAAALNRSSARIRTGLGARHWHHGWFVHAPNYKS
jgi:hypothetical protein